MEKQKKRNVNLQTWITATVTISAVCNATHVARRPAASTHRDVAADEQPRLQLADDGLRVRQLALVAVDQLGELVFADRLVVPLALQPAPRQRRLLHARQLLTHHLQVHVLALQLLLQRLRLQSSQGRILRGDTASQTTSETSLGKYAGENTTWH